MGSFRLRWQLYYETANSVWMLSNAVIWFSHLLSLLWHDNRINSSPLVPHICVSQSDQHWFRYWRVAASHYLNQGRIIINWILRNNLQWNFNQNTNFSIHKNPSEISSAKWRTFCPGGDELRWFVQIMKCVELRGNIPTTRYGDSAPRSVVGRLWGVVWILVGINVMSFLFSLMTSLITAELSVSSSIRGVQVKSGHRVIAHFAGSSSRTISQVLNFIITICYQKWNTHSSVIL